MRESEREFTHLGVAVRFVVIGTPELAREFCGRFGDASLCLADPDKRTYAAMGLEEYNLWRMPFDRKLIARGLANKAAGFRQNWRATRMKNAGQLPGAAYFDRDGVARWIYRGAHPGDLPPMAQMLEVVRSLSATRA